MNDNTPFGFAKLVPGFDFLQNLAKGAAQNIPQLPNLSNWVAPTLNVEELDKRITELKAVHFWLEQNGKALGATIQALEVQKMTLATLEGMNMKMGEVADALRLKPAAVPVQEQVQEKEPEMPTAQQSAAKPKKAGKPGDGAAAALDPLQWWGSLTQQFQAIAANAMKDAAQQTTVDAARNMATGAAREAIKAASGVARAASGMAAAPVTKAAPATAGKSAAKPAKKKPAARKAAPAKARSRK
jgi:hypothetical protein